MRVLNRDTHRFLVIVCVKSELLSPTLDALFDPAPQKCCLLPQVPTPTTRHRQGSTPNQVLAHHMHAYLCLALLPPCFIVALFIFFTAFSEILYIVSTQPSPNFCRSFSSCSYHGKLSQKQKTGEGESVLLLGSRARMWALPVPGHVPLLSVPSLLSSHSQDFHDFLSRGKEAAV